MANPQIENGRTEIANEIMDALCKIRIPGEERQILDCIFRKTYGWHKSEDAISLSQFVEMTGMNKPHVIKSIKGLLLKKVIIVTEKGTAPAKIYKINKDFDQWNPLPKKVTLPKKVIGVTEKGNLELPKKVPTKATITKATITKAILDDFDLFYKLYPNKKSPKDALNAWKKLNGTRPSIEIILDAIKKQIEWREKAKGEWRPDWKHPATWLRSGSWADEISEKNKKLEVMVI